MNKITFQTFRRWIFAAFMAVPSLADPARAQIVINELHAVADERFLRYDQFDQPHLGPGISWWDAGFQDGNWASGAAPLGFGYADLATNLNTQLNGVTPSLYVRKTFSVAGNATSLSGRLKLTVDYNDGFVAYLNGKEIARSHLGPPKLFVYADQTALSARNASDAPEVFDLGPASNLLQSGENLLSIQVHNHPADAKGNLRFAAGLEINEGLQSTVIVSENFNDANGASRTHQNIEGSISNTSSGVPLVGSWLDRSPLAQSSGSWTRLTAVTQLAATSGVSNGGALQYTFAGTGTGTASLRGPLVNFGNVWASGAVANSDLDALALSLKYKLPAGFIADLALETEDGAVSISLPSIPADMAPIPAETIGYWRFDEAGAASGGTISTAQSQVNGSTLNATGASSPKYSTDIPGTRIFDPVSGGTYDNKFSFNASAANSRIQVPNANILNTENFTVEFFVKLTGEPLDFDALLRRGSGVGTDTATTSTRRSWQVDFDSGLTAATYGRVRARWDTPGTPPLDWNRSALGNVIFADTPSADGNPENYGALADVQAAGDGVNDASARIWHHVALTWNAAKKQFQTITDYQASAAQMLSAPFVHPSAVLEFGKFANNSYGLLLDEVRYSNRVLKESELLRASGTDASGFLTYQGNLHQADTASRAAFLAALNGASQTKVRPVLKLRSESYSAAGKTLIIDDFQITDSRPSPIASFISAGDTWKYFVGKGEPSGGIWEPNLPVELNTADQPNTLPPFPDLPGFSDWIELKNEGSSSVSLDGWSLTDDATKPTQWLFPAGTTISPNGYLLVLADDHADLPGLAYLHTNFKMSEGGERVQLLQNGVLRSEVNYPRQDQLHSYGRVGETWAYFDVPSPGASNGGTASPSRVKTPDLSLAGGFYIGPQTLAITTETSGATIRYTLDGTEPTETNGNVYNGPIVLTAVDDKTGRVVRARAFLNGSVASGTRAATYLIDQNVKLRGVPALTFTADPQKDFYKPFGIMSIEGGTVDANNIWSAVNGDDYNLALMHGRPYERGIFAEWLNADGSPGFAEKAGLRLASSPYSRPRLKLAQTSLSPWVSTAFEKPSFNLFFRESYDKSELAYPVFGQDYPIKSFDELRHRAGKNDILNPFFKDEFVRRTFNDMGNHVSRGTFNTLYVNGVYKGYYNTVERYRAPFFQAHFDSKEDWDIRIMDAVEDGDSVEWTNTIAAFGQNLQSQANSDAALAKIDVDEVIDYFLINIYTAQSDWPNNNWVAARERSATGKYRLFLWDSEISFAQNAAKPVSFDTIQSDLKNLTGSLPSFFRAVYSSDEVKLRFADRINKHFFNGGALDDRDPTNSRLVRRKNELAAIVEPLLQFTAGQTVNDTFFTNWINPATGRRKWLFDSNGGASDVSFRKHGLWPVTEPPVFSQHGGTVAADHVVTISKPASIPAASKIYYTLDGSDPRLFAGAISPSALVYSSAVSFTSSAQSKLKARIRNASTNEWSALTEATFLIDTVPATSQNLVVSQLQYHPPASSEEEISAGFTDADEFEFIELQAVGSQNVDLSAVKIISGISFDFKDAAIQVLPAGEQLLLVKNKAAFLFRYGSGLAGKVAGEYPGKLDNSGERIWLTGTSGATIQDFAYNDKSPWPVAADGQGPSLRLLEPELLPNHSLSASWTATSAWGGSPANQVLPLNWTQWKSRHFTALQLGDSTQSASLADPDRDGIPNLLEFAFGTKPYGNETAPVLETGLFIANGVTYVSATARLSSQCVDFSPTVEVSTDLVHWQDAVPVGQSIDVGNPCFCNLRWRDIAPREDHQNRYFRLKIQTP